MTTEPHPSFKLQRSRVMFSRLMCLLERQRAELESDPAPFLDRAYREVSETRQRLQEVKYILSGMDTLYDNNDMPRSMASVLHERICKAQALLDKPLGETP